MVKFWRFHLFGILSFFFLLAGIIKSRSEFTFGTGIHRECLDI
jgi:hypothetical protein